MNPAELNSVTSDAALVSAILAMFKDNQSHYERALKDCLSLDRKKSLSPHARIGLYDQLSIIGNSTNILGEHWAVHANRFWDIALNNIFCTAVISAPTIGDALDVLTKHGFLWSPALNYEGYIQPGFKSIAVGVIDLPEMSASVQTGLQTLRELSVIGLFRLIDQTLGGKWTGSKVLLAEQTKKQRIFRNAFSVPIEFDAPRYGLKIPLKICQQESASADPAKHRKASLQIQKMITPKDKDRSLENIVTAYINATQFHRPTVNEVAKAFGMSTRTFNRKLEQAGVSFRQLLDQSLRNRTRLLLKQGQLSRGEISERLGYKDQASFSRALRRWQEH